MEGSGYQLLPCGGDCGRRVVARPLAEHVGGVTAPANAETARACAAGRGVLFHRIHAAGIYHQDLKGTNILWQDSTVHGPRLYLVDVGDVTRPRRLAWRRRVRNLVQMCEIPGRFWTNREKALFLKYYSDLCGLSRDDRRSLVRDVLDASI